MIQARRLLMAVCGTIVGLGLACGSASANEDFWKKVQQEGVLKVGGAEATPYQMRDPKTGEWSGVYIDILRMLADQLGVKLQVIDTTWDDLVAGLVSGKWDIAPSLNRTVKRSLVVNYSIPAHAYQISFVFKKTNSKIDPSWISLADFDKPNITFAVKGGTAEEQILTQQVKNATISRFPGQDEFRLAVVTGRADIAVDDADPNALFAASYPEWSHAVIPVPALAKQGVAFGFRKTVGLDEIQTLDILLEQLIAQGKVDKMFEEYDEKIVGKK